MCGAAQRAVVASELSHGRLTPLKSHLAFNKISIESVHHVTHFVPAIKVLAHHFVSIRVRVKLLKDFTVLVCQLGHKVFHGFLLSVKCILSLFRLLLEISQVATLSVQVHLSVCELLDFSFEDSLLLFELRLKQVLISLSTHACFALGPGVLEDDLETPELLPRQVIGVGLTFAESLHPRELFCGCSDLSIDAGHFSLLIPYFFVLLQDQMVLLANLVLHRIDLNDDLLVLAAHLLALGGNLGTLLSCLTHLSSEPFQLIDQVHALGIFC